MFSNDHTMFNLYTNHLYITQGSFDLITIYHLQTSKAKNIKNFMNISNLLEPMFDNFQVSFRPVKFRFQKNLQDPPQFFILFLIIFPRHLGKVSKLWKIYFHSSFNMTSLTHFNLAHIFEQFSHIGFQKLYYFKLVFS